MNYKCERGKCKVDNLEKLNAYSSMSDNWNGYGAKAIPKNVIEKAKAVCLQLSDKFDVFPTGRSSVQFEIESKDGEYLELEVGEVGIETLYISKDGREESQDIGFNVDDIKRIVSKFIG